MECRDRSPILTSIGLLLLLVEDYATIPSNSSAHDRW